GLFDLKHDPGGMVDVEFSVQYLVLAHAHAHPQLTRNAGNIALLKLAADLGLVPAAIAAGAAEGYREYRRLQHQIRLQGAREARVDHAVSYSHLALRAGRIRGRALLSHRRRSGDLSAARPHRPPVPLGTDFRHEDSLHQGGARRGAKGVRGEEWPRFLLSPSA